MVKHAVHGCLRAHYCIIVGKTKSKLFGDLDVWESSWKGAANHTCANVSRSTCLPFSMGLEPKLYLALCREFKLQLAIQVLVNSKL